MIMNPIEINHDDQSLPPGPSHLFLLRVWMPAQDEPKDQTNWRGRLQDPVTGETRQFHSWGGLQRAIHEFLVRQHFQGG